MNNFEQGFIKRAQEYEKAGVDLSELAMHPTLLGTLSGAGVGALATKDKKNRLRNALIGAGVGGGLGYGAGELGRKHLGKLIQKELVPVNDIVESLKGKYPANQVPIHGLDSKDSDARRYFQNYLMKSFLEQQQKELPAANQGAVVQGLLARYF